MVGAKIDTAQTFVKFEKNDSKEYQGTKIGFGKFSFSIGKKITRRILGYTSSEDSIKLNTPIYVLGEANDRSGKLCVSKPRDRDLSFIVSIKSEDEIVVGLEKSMDHIKYASIIALAIGGILIVVGIVSLIIE